MKTKIISVLLCVCMLAGVLTVMSSAALDKSDDANYEAKITIKDPLEIPVGTTETAINDSIATYLVSSNSAVKISELSTYFQIQATLDPTKTFLSVHLVEIKAKNVNEDGNQLVTLTNPEVVHNLSYDSLLLTAQITWVTKLYDLQMGVRKYGENGNNLVSSNIATVTATVNSTAATSVQDKIYDLKYDDTVTLTATLKPDYATYYEFFCWVDGAGNVKQYTPTVTVVIRESCAVFAVYREKADRYVVTYNASEGGKIIFSDGDNLKIFEGDGQVSVFDGSSPKFTFVPDEGYEVSKVIINKGTDSENEVSNLKNLFTSLSSLFSEGKFDDALSVFGTYADATNKDVYSYTFSDIGTNSTIDVTFIKSKVYEPASGVEYVPGPELSTGTSEAADADGDGAAATTLPAEGGNYSDADVANPQTGSTTAIAAFATLSLAAAAAFVTAKKKRS